MKVVVSCVVVFFDQNDADVGNFLPWHKSGFLPTHVQTAGSLVDVNRSCITASHSLRTSLGFFGLSCSLRVCLRFM